MYSVLVKRKRCTLKLKRNVLSPEQLKLLSEVPDVKHVVYAHVISSSYSCILTVSKLQDCFTAFIEIKPNEGESRQSDINVWTLIVITFYVSVMFDLSVAAEAPSKFL